MGRSSAVVSTVLALGSALACYRPREMAPQVPLDGIDGKYSFTISNETVKMEGKFIVAYSQVHMLEPRRCVPVDGPKSSDGLRASWFECSGGNQRQRGESSLRLRISEVDPINLSRWYAHMRVPDTVSRCTRYTASGDCVELLRARGMKWVDRNGSITVVKGFPVGSDTGRSVQPSGSQRLRARCDTGRVKGSCGPREK